MLVPAAQDRQWLDCMYTQQHPGQALAFPSIKHRKA